LHLNGVPGQNDKASLVVLFGDELNE